MIEHVDSFPWVWASERHDRCVLKNEPAGSHRSAHFFAHVSRKPTRASWVILFFHLIALSLRTSKRSDQDQRKKRTTLVWKENAKKKERIVRSIKPQLAHISLFSFKRFPFPFPKRFPVSRRLAYYKKIGFKPANRLSSRINLLGTGKLSFTFALFILKMKAFRANSANIVKERIVSHHSVGIWKHYVGHLLILRPTMLSANRRWAPQALAHNLMPDRQDAAQDSFLFSWWPSEEEPKGCHQERNGSSVSDPRSRHSIMTGLRSFSWPMDT